MSYKQKKDATKRRGRLFRNGKPDIREAKFDDIGIMWSAHKRGSFDFPEMDEDTFRETITAALGRFTMVWIAEDRNSSFSSGFGPIAMFGANFDGWRIEPHVVFFGWATKRNKLRAIVAFLRMMQTSREIGVCVVRALKGSLNLMRRMKDYGVLFPVGNIPYGTPNGNEYIFYVKGRMDGLSPK